MTAHIDDMPQIIYKDEAMLAINKPAGMPSVSLKKGDTGTLAAWILKKFPKQTTLEKGELEAGLAHRLDNDTSGIIIAARTVKSQLYLRALFRHGGVFKEYLALVMGNAPNKGLITVPIAHHPSKKKRMLVCKTPAMVKKYKARPASTKFWAIKRYEHYSLLGVQIETGVRHQIRVHLASVGLPLAGDKLYQNPKKRAQDTLPLRRHFLHASRLGFTHPKTGKRVEFSSDLPQDLKETMRNMRPIAA